MCSIIGALHNTNQALIKHRCIMQLTHATDMHEHDVHILIFENKTSVCLQGLRVKGKL